MPYVLLVAAAVVAVVGVTRLRASEWHEMPWGPLLLWAVLSQRACRSGCSPPGKFGVTHT